MYPYVERRFEFLELSQVHLLEHYIYSKKMARNIMILFIYSDIDRANN